MSWKGWVSSFMQYVLLNISPAEEKGTASFCFFKASFRPFTSRSASTCTKQQHLDRIVDVAHLTHTGFNPSNVRWQYGQSGYLFTNMRNALDSVMFMNCNVFKWLPSFAALVLLWVMRTPLRTRISRLRWGTTLLTSSEIKITGSGRNGEGMQGRDSNLLD